jgi:predicted negative regulator of RcsB-dependent stress response
LVIACIFVAVIDDLCFDRKLADAAFFYIRSILSLQNPMKGSSNLNSAHSALLQLVDAFINARDLSDADDCWRTAFKMDSEFNQRSLNKLLDVYVAEKKYDKAIALLNF